MSQEDILKYLKKKKRWVSTSELSGYLNITGGNISNACQKLKKQNEILIRKLHRENEYRMIK